MSDTSRPFGTLLKSMLPSGKEENVTVETPEIDTKNFSIPESFDPRSSSTSSGQGDGRWEKFLTPIYGGNWGKYLTGIYDQGLCSACYSFSTVSCLSDRFALQTLLQVKPYFNPLEPVMCYIETKNSEDYQKILNNLQQLQQAEISHRSSQGCRGDTLFDISVYLFRWGAVEDNCVSISLLQQSLKKTGQLPLCTIIEGPDQNLCVDPKIPQRAWPIYNFYQVNGSGDELIKNIKLEVLKWGPISVAFNIFPDFLHSYDGNSIYIPKSGQKSLGGHAVKLIGWGTEKDTPYWICANSWGVDYGEHGYFRIVQGNKDLELESNHMCVWPMIPGITTAPKIYSKVYLLNQETINERDFNGVDPLTFYPAKVTKMIKDGKLQGSLTPVINRDLVPVPETFFAYQIGYTKFPTFGGTSISIARTINNSAKSNFVWWFVGLISLIVVIIFILIYRKRYYS
jgi:hypothetical protein